MPRKKRPSKVRKYKPRRIALSRTTSAWLDPRVTELLDLFLKVASDVGEPYAIGGALAMGAHGYRRHTSDVDAYVEYDKRGKWIRSLRQHGLEVQPLFAGVHYVALLPEHNDPEIRIDLLVPAEEPELSAIDFPDTSSITGRPAEVWPSSLLVIAKFRSERQKDQADVDEMFERGMFDPREVRTHMLQMNDPDLARAFWRKFGGGKR